MISNPDIQLNFMPHRTYRLINQMYDVAITCLAYCVYFKEIQKQKSDKRNSWLIATHNAYYDLCVMHWCMLFGSEHNEPTHFYHLLDKKYHLKERMILSNSDKPSKQALRNLILSNSKINHAEFHKLKITTVQYRNKNLIHREHNPDFIHDKCMNRPVVRNLLKTAYSLYELITNIASTYPKQPDHSNKYRHICRIFRTQTGLSHFFLQSFPSQLSKKQIKR